MIILHFWPFFKRPDPDPKHYAGVCFGLWDNPPPPFFFSQTNPSGPLINMLKHFQIWLRVCGDIHIENSNLGLDNQLDLDSSSLAMFSHIPFMDWQSQRVCYFFVYIMLWIYFCCKYILWSFVWTLPKDLLPVVFHKFLISQHPALQQCSISRRWARGFTVTRWPAKQEERGQQLIVKKMYRVPVSVFI